MKTPRIVNAVGHIDHELISAAVNNNKSKKKIWLKCGGYIAACFAVMLVALAIVLPMLHNDGITPPIGNEYVYEKGYCYSVDDGVFSSYVGGKVIEEEKVGNKLYEVSVTAGWKNENNEWISTEKLRAYIYTIEGVPDETAVTLKFIDKGEAVTTTHYYVILNPNADLTAVEDYIIAPTAPNNSGEEMAGETLE